jgi:DNA-binding LacI/PurR family transcriptional regulator
LIKLGRKRIAFLGDIAEPEIRLRREGYRKAIENSSLEFDPDLMFSAPFDGQEARIAAIRMIDSGVRFDSIFCGSDVIAMSAVIALRRRGVRVPEDVAVVGYDDIMMAANFDPAITTVSQQIPKGGRLMVDLLFKAIEGKPIETTLLPVQLKVRESCGAGEKLSASQGSESRTVV